MHYYSNISQSARREPYNNTAIGFLQDYKKTYNLLNCYNYDNFIVDTETKILTKINEKFKVYDYAQVYFKQDYIDNTALSIYKEKDEYYPNLKTSATNTIVKNIPKKKKGNYYY